MKTRNLTILLGLMLIALSPIMAQPSNTAKLEAEILELVNIYRESKGFPKLMLNDFIKQEAQTHSSRMATGKTPFSHQGFDDRFGRIGAKYKVSEGSENVAYGPNSAYKIVENWIKNDTYKENIENKTYNATGIGVAADRKGGFYVTMIMVNSPERPKIVPEEFEQKLLKLINDHRKEFGLTQLTPNEQIRTEAKKYTELMVSGKVPLGPPSFGSSVKELVYKMGGREMAELISYHFDTPESVYNTWMHSTHQRATIEGSYNLTGIGVIQSQDGRVFVTQIFMLKR